MKIYTRKGDDGTTGLLYGGRVPKDSVWPVAYGTVDEAQSFLGVARAAVGTSPLAELILRLQRDLWVLMAELATDPANRSKLQPGTGLVTAAMVTDLESLIDSMSAEFEPPTEFVVPGEHIVAAHLDVARTVVRRAERDALTAFATLTDGAPSEGSVATESHCLAYLNRLSDLLWTLARWQESQVGSSRATRG
jgi:cob(I)alamin adenosyltransferase